MTDQTTWPDIAGLALILMFFGWLAWLWMGQR